MVGTVAQPKNKKNVNWTIECIDDLGAKANATEGYFNYTIINSTILVDELSPNNNTWEINHSVSFTYNATSDGDIESCSLWLEKASTW